MNTHFVRFLKVTDDPQKLGSDSVPIIWAVCCLSVVLDDGSGTEMVHSLFTEGLTAIFCIENAVFLVYKFYNVMDADPFVCCIFEGSVLLDVCHGEQCQTT